MSLVFRNSFLALIFAGVLFGSVHAQVIEDNPKEFENVDVVEHIGSTIDLNLDFLDEEGQPVKLSEFFGKGKPVVLNLVYYECPMLCTLVLNGITESLNKIKATWKPGEDYQMLSISIDHREIPEVAQVKREAYLKELKAQDHPGAWRFLLGSEENVKKIADQIGFQYRYDQRMDEYAHPAVTFFLTESGKISRYLYGVSYEAKDVRFALGESAKGKTISTVEKVLLYCYRYDPNQKGYVLFAANVMKVGGLTTILLLSLFLGLLWRAEKISTKKEELEA
ncbi:MAG: SCO family protein [Bdellovibrionota bacterium]